MTTLTWSDEYVLNVPQMDTTHQEFIALLAAVESASDADLVPAWQRLVDHTEAHFQREDQWMQDTGFAAGNCHATQHRIVLQVMQHGAEQSRAGDLAMVRQMASELAVWFPQHAGAMDAALAAHLHSVGYDTTTGTVHAPEALPHEAIHSCAGPGCAPAKRGETADALPA